MFFLKKFKTDILWAIFSLSILLAPFANASTCLLSDAERARLAVLVSGLPETPYSYQGFFYDHPHWREYNERYNTHQYLNFDPSTTAGDLLDQQGNLLLFRSIGRVYTRGFTGEGNDREYIRSEGSAYSYSLSPFIVEMWSRNGEGNLALLSWQNMDQGLRYPHILEEYTPQAMLERKPFSRETLLIDIAYYDEVKVPVEAENVVAIIEQAELRKILAPFKGRRFRVRELMSEVLNFPGLRSPDCSESRP